VTALKGWLETQLAQKHVEPNSDLGKTYKYMLMRWPKLTGSLPGPGVPIDNNTCERALKMAICHQQNSLFHRSDRGAEIGDMFMWLIYTAELRGENPFQYLTTALHNEKASTLHPPPERSLSSASPNATIPSRRASALDSTGSGGPRPRTAGAATDFALSCGPGPVARTAAGRTD
jgi:hypothetical protein